MSSHHPLESRELVRRLATRALLFGGPWVSALGVSACGDERDEPAPATTTMLERPGTDPQPGTVTPAAATPYDDITTAPGPTPSFNDGEGDVIVDPITRPQPSSNTASAAAEDALPDNAFCSDVTDWEPAWSELEREILTLVNEVRARGATCGDQTLPPAPPLAMNAALRCAAREHSLDMVERDYFDHVSPDGDDPGDRITDGAGYVGRGWGENIAGGSASAAGTMQQWLDSPGHCQNIMRASFRFLGVGYYPGGMYRFMWTQTFGA